MRVLRKFSDARMVGLTRDIAEAVRESSQDEADSQANFQRRLSDRLAPKLEVMQQLRREMFPGSSDEIELDMPEQWNGKLQVDFGSATPVAASARRLQGSLEEIDVGGVHAQAHTLF